MNKTTKKVLSLVLMMLMLVSSLPMTAFAAKECSGLYDTHDFGTYVTTTAPTCSSKGVATAECKRLLCTAKSTQELAIVPTAHKPKNVAEQAATCTMPGHTEGVICEYCLVTISGCQLIPALGHNSSVVVTAKDANCTDNGNTAGTKCSVCDTVTSGVVTLPATGHSFTEYTNPYPNCATGTPGLKTKACLTCGYKEAAIEIAATHNYGSWKTVTAATCKTEGSRTRTCLVCGYVDTQVVEKLNHTLTTIAAKDATCTAAGYTAGKECSKCDYKEGKETIPAKGHTLEVVPGTPATCTAKGKTDATKCSVCKEILTAATDIAALGHDMKKDASSVEATCTTTGTLVEKCSRCSNTTTKTLPVTHEVSWSTLQKETCTTAGKRMGYCAKCNTKVEEIVPATGHTVTNNSSWIETVAATCTKEGTKEANCSVCGKKTTKAIPALGHTEVVYKLAEAATCQKVGYTESKYCSVCKTVTVPAKEVAKTDHTYGEWTTVKTATCAAAGIEKAACTVCKEEKTRTVDRLKHTEKTIPAVAATCTTDGSTEGIECTVCSAKIKEVEVIKALGHDYIKDATSKDATCTDKGYFKGTCSRCKVVKEEELAALGHTEEVIPGTPADCTLDGLSDGKKCITCKEITVDQEPIPALGHKLVADPAKSVPATCTEKGKNFMTCSACAHTEEQEVAPLEHTWGEWEEVTAPTCDAQGAKKRTCATCKLVEEAAIDSLGGHELVTLPGYEATCTEPGKTNGSHCQKCNTIFEAQDEIPATGHDIDGVEPELIKATTDREGTYAEFCKVCNEAVNPITIAKIDAASIKLSTEKCTYNGKKRTPSVSVSDVDGNPLTEGVDFEVEYAEGRKNVGEYPIKVKFIGNYEGEKELTFTIAAGKTTKVTATSSKKDYVKLSWNAVEGATGYRVYIYKTADSKTRKKIASVEGTSYNLSKDYNGKALKIGSEYKIAIVAYTKLEDGTVIHALAGVANTFTRKAGKPDLTVTSASGKAKLSWTDVSGETAYQVYYATSKDGEFTKLASGVTAAAYTTKTFTKGKTLYFKVRAYTKVDGEVIYGSFSSVKSVTIK